MVVDNTAVEIIYSVDFDFNLMSENVPEIIQISWIGRFKRIEKIITYLKMIKYD
jgi:hypothetical protein